MLLSDWFKKPGNKMTQSALGEKVGVTQGRISQIALKGTRDFPMIRKIVEATNHDVTADELLPASSRAEDAG